MDGFKITYINGNCLFITGFHSGIDKDVVQINFKLNAFYVLSEKFGPQNRVNENSVHCFEDLNIDVLLFFFILDIFIVHSWKHFRNYID